jgi:hypothetical protein
MKHTPELILTLLIAAVSWLFALSSSSPLPETASRPVPLTIANEMLVVTCDDAWPFTAQIDNRTGEGRGRAVWRPSQERSERDAPEESRQEGVDRRAVGRPISRAAWPTARDRLGLGNGRRSPGSNGQTRCAHAGHRSPGSSKSAGTSDAPLRLVCLAQLSVTTFGTSLREFSSAWLTTSGNPVTDA